MKNFFKSAFGFLQKTGKSLMLPVSVLPVAGLMLGIGSAHFAIFPEALSNVMASSSGAIFGNLALLFAVGVALGFTSNDGVAAMAAMVGYAVMSATLTVMAKIFGLGAIETGVFGGILIGGMAAYLYNRYHTIELPPYLGFFGGKRFIPIVTSFSAIIAGIVLAYIWPPIGGAIKSFSQWAASDNPQLAFTIYGIGERSLIPFGLHHIWNAPFFFETGSFLDPATGKTVTGEIARYLSGDPTAGNLAGGYLFKMWGLPAAAIAMWHSAKPENRLKVGGIMISAALTSFVTGITEPIEFSFLFVAPILYAVHALLSGLAFFVCILAGIKHGTTFSHGLIDFIVLFPKSANAWYLLVLGPIWAGVYYGVFRFVIAKFNLKTPGREVETEEAESAGATPAADGDEFIGQLVAAFGGGGNIKSLDACITRLRVQLHDTTKLQDAVFKQLGANGVLKAGNGAQVIFGPRSENIKTKMEAYLKRAPTGTTISKVVQSQTGEKAAATPVNKVYADGWVDLVGGKANVLEAQVVSHTRVRVLLKNERSVDLNALKTKASGMGMSAEIYPGQVLHIVAGTQAHSVCAGLQ